MFHQSNRGKIKNAKILGWRLTTSDIRHKPGSENIAADAFSRACVLSSLTSLRNLHRSMGHPGYARLYHFVRQRNLHCSCDETGKVCRNCRTCTEVTPFFRPPSQTFVQAVRPWDRSSVDFKGPARGSRPYLLIVIDEYSRFPFVFPCKNGARPRNVPLRRSTRIRRPPDGYGDSIV